MSIDEMLREALAAGMTLEYAEALVSNADRWVPACGGKEAPFTKNGTRWLYVWNPKMGQHGYLNLDSDLVVSSLDD
jgi:hypothetical protein